jgi:hypothetical protein
MARVRQDWAFYAFIFGYAVVVAAIAYSLGEADKFVPLVYYPRWIEGLLYVIAALVGVIAVRAMFHAEPLERMKAGLKAMVAPQALSGLLLFMALPLFYGAFTSMKTMLPDITPFRWDPLLADVDAALHGQDPWLWLRFLDPITGPLASIYGKSWFYLLTLSSLLVCVWPRLQAMRAQFLWTFLLCWSLLGNLLAGVFMSAGPIYYQSVVGDVRFAGLTTHLQALPASNPIHWYPAALWTAYAEHRSGFGSGISAFPSMHLSMATLFALLGFRIDRRLGWAMVAYLAVIMAGSVHLGWHYAVDGYFSIAATALIWKAVGLMERWSPAPVFARRKVASA